MPRGRQGEELARRLDCQKISKRTTVAAYNQVTISTHLFLGKVLISTMPVEKERKIPICPFERRRLLE